MAEIKTDCFAYNDICESCRALRKLYCQNEEECHFYKPKREVKQKPCSTSNS